MLFETRMVFDRQSVNINAFHPCGRRVIQRGYQKPLNRVGMAFDHSPDIPICPIADPARQTQFTCGFWPSRRDNIRLAPFP